MRFESFNRIIKKKKNYYFFLTYKKICDFGLARTMKFDENNLVFIYFYYYFKNLLKSLNRI